MHARADEIIEVASSFIGLRYKHHGRGGGSMDCVGLPICIARTLGLSDWDTTDYGPRPNLQEFNRLIRETGATRIPMADLSNGDMVQISYNRAPPVHVGIIEVDASGQKWCIHAFRIHRKVTRDPVTPEMRKTFVAAWRLPG